MRKHILAVAALAAGLSAASFALAQNMGATNRGTGSVDSGMSSSGSTGGEDAANYMTGPGVRLFYTDEAMSTLRSPDEMRGVYNNLDPNDQQVLVRSCASNEDTRFADLCTAVGTW